jgi:hypothetical protein
MSTPATPGPGWLLRPSTKTAFYLANTPVTAARAAEAIRAHWRIKNTSHYSRDVTLGKDHLRIRTNPSVVARLRSFTFNILKANRTQTLSQDRYRAGLASIKHLLSLTATLKRWTALYLTPPLVEQQVARRISQKMMIGTPERTPSPSRPHDL